ncbi:MAG TPA: polyketide synthase dehydratase domain-containing protein [Candidatus Bathyarchaeia archaeon]|nr:polyketide synthase dehydratase domain-containing protein [Candidatus Bathyarchaeia archaeon]
MEENILIARDTFPMVGKITQKDDSSITCERALSLENDWYLDDHRFNNTPFLPGVMGLELFTELAKILFPQKTIQRFEEVHFYKAIRLKGDKPSTITTTITSKDEYADAVITTTTTDSSGNTSEVKLHFKAKLIFGKKEKELQKTPTIKAMPLLTHDFIYQILPHGPSFQVLEEINSIENEMVAISKISKKQLFGWNVKELLIDPYAIEAGFQAIGLMDFILSGRAGLPSKIKQIMFYESAAKPYFIIGKETVEQSGLFDFRILSRKGEVILKVFDHQMVETNLGETSSILEKLRSHRIRQLVPMPKKSWLEVIDKQLFLDKLSHEPEFVTTFLCPDELDKVEKLTARDKNETLLELFAVKRALRVVLLSRKMLEFKVEKDDSGDYYCSYKGKYIYLTVAKGSTYLLVLASRKRKYGLYFYNKEEKIKPMTDALFSSDELIWFEERKLINTNAIQTQVFIAKQAVLNFLGAKVKLDFKDISIHSFRENNIGFQISSLKLPTKQKRQIKNQTKQLNVSLNQNEKYILAICS